jgi:pimeloyl-ACP methyl ester carboxylesterase
VKRKILLALAALLVVGGAVAYTPDRERAALEARYLADPADLRPVGGTTLHVRDEGPRDAPVLLLLHGLGSSLHTWNAWADTLRTRYRVVRLDLPGHGLSGPAPEDDYSDERTRTLLVALLDTLDIDRATVIGNSMGGRFAWQFAAARPERVDRLVLIAPDGFASPGFEYDRPPEVPALLSLMRWVLPRPLLAANLEAAYADPSVMTDTLLSRYHDLMLAPGNREAMLARMRQLILRDPRPRLERITAPTLLLWGEEDGMIPVRNAEDYLAAIPDARRVVLPGVGHLPFEEAPQRALSALLDFLEPPTPGRAPDDGAATDAADPTGDTAAPSSR